MIIGIVVDHPKRDLPALTILAEKILTANKNSKNSVILIPMYNLALFLNYLNNLNYKIDSIVFNFMREANKKFIKQAKNCGINVIIYDQEGVGGRDGTLIAEPILEVKDYLKYVDLYCFWGEMQKKRIISSVEKNKLPKKIIVSGWLNSDYLFTIKKEMQNKIKSKKKILINSNFSGVDPRFNTLEKEIETRLKSSYHSKKEILKRIEYTKKRKRDFILSLNILFKQLPNYQFTIRPHPYENRDQYIKLAREYKNCKLDQNTDINNSLKTSKLFIHVDCTSAVSSTYLNIPTLSMDWIINDKKKEEYNMVANKIGIKSETITEAINLIKLKKYKSKKFNQKYLEKFYGKFDGNRCLNLSKEILKLKKNIITKNNQYIKSNLKDSLKFYLLKLLGEKKYFILKKIFLKKKFLLKKKKDKYFSKPDLYPFLKKGKFVFKNLPFNCIHIENE